MTNQRHWASGWRGGVLIVAGVVLGATVIQPAVAHVTSSVTHLTSKHLDQRYVNTSEASGGDLSGPHGDLQIENGAVTGAEVEEGTLGQVPSAEVADNATNAQNAVNATNAQNAVNAQTATDANNVDGNSIERFSFNTSSASLTTLFTLGGLTLKASCVPNDLNVYVATDISNSYFRTSVGNSDTDFDTADNDLLVFSADTSDANGTMVYRRNVGPDAVTVTFGYETNPSVGNSCQLLGVAVGTS
jgi:hypothetical protein